MAKFKCLCGQTIETSGLIPNPHEWRIISDIDFDAFSGLVQADDLYRSSAIMYRCPKSDHIWIYWHGLDDEPTAYSPQ